MTDTITKTVGAREFGEAWKAADDLAHQALVLSLISCDEVGKDFVLSTFVETYRPVPDTFNYGMLGNNGDDWTYVNPSLVTGPISKPQALSMAAYLFLLPGEGDFEAYTRVLDALRNS